MVDNTELNAGSGGNTVRTDEVGGVHHQGVKVVIGADGSDDGFVSESNPIPVKGQGIAWNAPTSVSVGASSTVVLASNAVRKGAVITNDSDTVIYLGIGSAAVLNSGIRLNSGGGVYEINLMNLSTQAINAISLVASKTLAVHEAV